MLGSSRESLARCSQALEAASGASDLASVGEELFAVAALLSQESALRSVCADSGQPASVREGLIRDVLRDQVGATATSLTLTAVGQRWADDMDLVYALETLAAQAIFTVAQNDGSLDATEDDMFVFGRAVAASPELQMALTDPAVGSAAKAAIVRDLVKDRATVAATMVLSYNVAHLHGRRIDSVVDALCALAAQQRERLVANVRVARPLDSEQEQRLSRALSALKGRNVRLNVAVDPSVMGGVLVTVGDEVIDGTVASRLEQARRALLG